MSATATNAIPEMAEIWAKRADAMKEWTWTRLVNRTDIWGGYHKAPGKEYTAKDGTKRKSPKTVTRPPVEQRGDWVLTKSIIRHHYCALARQDIVGVHSTRFPENTSKWGATDIDHHGEGSTPAAVNLKAAMAWYDGLVAANFRPLLIDSNGAGGYHLWVLFREPLPTATVFNFMRAVVGDHAEYGMDVPPEVFPKQSRVTANNPCGNWLRLPGKHHSREHWSKVWDGSQWLDGNWAIDFMLTLTGDEA